MFACIHTLSTPHSALSTEWARAFSPRLEQVASGTVVLDVAGLERLWGSPQEMAESIARRGGELGLEVNVAVASNPDAAVCAARSFPGITVIPPGEEARVLGSLPVEVLAEVAEWPRPFWSAGLQTRGPRRARFWRGGVEAGSAGPGADAGQAGLETGAPKSLCHLETLRLWGIRSFRDLAALPEAGLAERLGQDGVRLRQLARGAGAHVLVPANPAPRFEQSLELEYPVDNLEPLSFVLARLLQQLSADLENRALATQELRLRLQLEDETALERTLRLPFPTRDRKALLELLRLHLESHPPEAPVESIVLSAEPARPRALENGLFLPLAPEPEKLELTLARIAKLVGAENAGSPELLDTHRPDAFRMERFPNADGRLQITDSRMPEKRQPLLALRRFRPPLPAQVEMDGQACPYRIQAPGLGGRVTWRAGPWRSSGDWWTPEAWAREEWDVALGPSQALYCICRDFQSDCWFVEGSYD